ncbi:MAG: hypothetical protein K2F78_01730 [Muribaculaceae bacterium]|nr:hypothetical protein [Muribaculaceae bacterium]
MKRLTEKDLQKFSTISGVSMIELLKLQGLGALDEKRIIDYLIRHDYKHIQRGGKYTHNQIREAIMLEYQISKTKVDAAIYEIRKKEYVCPQCGSIVSSKTTLSRNGGVCEKCVIKSISQQL